MITVTVLALIDIALRLNVYDTRTLSDGRDPRALDRRRRCSCRSGATFGGTLVFDYGFNVETAGDSPVWHQSETDVLPGEHAE